MLEIDIILILIISLFIIYIYINHKYYSLNYIKDHLKKDI